MQIALQVHLRLLGVKRPSRLSMCVFPGDQRLRPFSLSQRCLRGAIHSPTLKSGWEGLHRRSINLSIPCAAFTIILQFQKQHTGSHNGIYYIPSRIFLRIRLPLVRGGRVRDFKRFAILFDFLNKSQDIPSICIQPHLFFVKS